MIHLTIPSEANIKQGARISRLLNDGLGDEYIL
jgi:hypothetical protein